MQSGSASAHAHACRANAIASDSTTVAALPSAAARSALNAAASNTAVIPRTTVSFSAATPSVARLIFWRMAHTTTLAGSSRRLAIAVSSFEWEVF